MDTVTLIEQLEDWANSLAMRDMPTRAIIAGMQDVVRDLKREVDEDAARPNWERDEIQFPRLLAEFYANCDFRDGDMDTLCEAMDLIPGDINNLFERAQAEWERIKETTCPIEK